jgi:FMN-dependent NADH-azoreductase
MKNILAIYTSAAGNNSTSKLLAKEWINQQEARLVERDLAEVPINHFDNETLSAFFTSDPSQLNSSQNKALEASDLLIDEVQTADCIVFAIPMYNFGIPSILKAWYDQIARAGKTFTFTDSGPQGLLNNKKAIVILSRGGFHQDSGHDFMTPYVKQLLGFIGITDVKFIFAEGTAMGHENMQLAISNATHELTKIKI